MKIFKIFEKLRSTVLTTRAGAPLGMRRQPHSRNCRLVPSMNHLTLQRHRIPNSMLLNSRQVLDGTIGGKTLADIQIREMI